MPRLIDAEKLIGLCNIMADKCDGMGTSIWEQFRTTVEWSPTVDAEEVVRCKDCKYLEEDECPWTGVIDWNGYCSRGEKRKDGGQNA